MRALWILAIVGCAPTIDGPIERARLADREDAAALTAQLRALPGATAAEVIIRRPARDPFTNAAPPTMASVVIVIDDPAYRSAIADATTRLVHAVVPEVNQPEIVVQHRVAQPQVVSSKLNVGAPTKSRFSGALIIALSLIAVFAGYIAWRERALRAHHRY